MPPQGPRSRQPPPPGAQRAPPPGRSEVFENIFGRPAGGHHLGHGPPGAPGGPGGARPQFGGYPGANAPPPAPVYNPAQPGYPPALAPQLPPAGPNQGYSQHAGPGPRVYGQHGLGSSGGGSLAPGPPPGAHGHQQSYPSDGFDFSRPSAGSMTNGFPQPQPRGSSYGSAPHPDPQQRQTLPNRRASLTPSLASSMTQRSHPIEYTNSPSAAYSSSSGVQQAPPPQNGGLQRAPTTSYNGFASHPADRLPTLSSLQEHAYGGTAPSTTMPTPQPRSVSATAVPTAASAAGAPQPTQTSIPPRSRSLHHAAGPSKIRVSIPQPSVNPGVSPAQPYPPSASRTSSGFSGDGMGGLPTTREASPPPDYLRAMNSITLNSGRGTPGPLDDIAGIPDRSSTDLGALRGPWEPSVRSNPNKPPTRSVDTRHMSSSSASSQPRGLHSRMPSDSSIASSIYTIGGARMAPLSQIGGPGAESPNSPSTPTGSENGYGFHRLSGRKSMESTHSLPLPTSLQDSPLPPGAANSVFDHRATSFSGSAANRREIISQVRSSGGSQLDSKGLGISVNNGGGGGGPGSPVTPQRSLVRHQSQARQATLLTMAPVVPSLLSSVAEAFRQLIQPAELHKEGLAYKDSFDGRAAVSILADIIKTPDRNLALLLGRALDAQKFFHDVTYAHRLRDTPNEIYQFKERLVAPFMNETDSPSPDHLGLTRPSSSSSGVVARRSPARHQAHEGGSDSTSSFFPQPKALGTPVELDDDSDDDLPQGVFTLLTECYSPTCTRERLCYSINCPRRLEQMKRLNMKAHPGLNRKIEDDVAHDDAKDTGRLWKDTVSQEVFESVDEKEWKRQEAINEVIYTERDFVRDLEYLRDSWVKPLRSADVVPATRRDDFVRQVFWNVHDVLTVNVVLAERLSKRQKQQPVVQSVGDIFLECVPHFEPFVVYGAHQLFGKYEFEKEKGANPTFLKFVDETERKPESRKLELNGYLTKPTTRLGRYPLLLEAVLKHTPDDHPDKQDLPEVIKLIRGFLAKVNEESGKSENIFELAQIEQQLMFRPHENIDLRLRDKNRELVHKGPLKRRGGTQGENADLFAFLFDHAFLLVKSKWVNKAEQYKVYRRPIPLELLVLITPEDVYNSAKMSASSRKLISRSNTKGQVLAHVPPKPESKHGFSLTVHHLGRKGYSLQLWVDTYVSRKKWIESIEKQQQTIRDRSTIFMSETITDNFFQNLRRINCISPYDNGNRMIYGTDEGVYFSNLRDPKLREPVKVINLVDVTQVDVVEEYQLLIVLHERSVTTFPLDCLDPNDPNAALKRGKRISSHTSFFKSGVCLGRTLVAVVKSSPLSSTIKVLEPVDQNMRNKKPQGGFMKRLNGAQDTLKVFKEFYIPLESFSVYFLKTKLCVGCQKGFEIVDLETLDMQSLLDPSDASLDFVLKRDGVRPMAIYRIESDFLLCYDEFAFYVNKNGWRSRPKWAIIWEGSPTSFALQYPYVIAFEPSFIEVRNVETSHLVQIIPGHNINCLFADMPPSTVNAPPMPQSRQLMYGAPGAQGNMYRPPPQQQQQQQQQQPGYPQGGFGGFPQPKPYGQQQQQQVRPPMPGGYGMPHPMAPIRNFSFRPQVIFTSDDGHVQFLKLPPPQAKNRRSSDSRSIHSTTGR